MDDLLIVRDQHKVEGTFSLLAQELVMKKVGKLEDPGDKLDFLGRRTTRTSDSFLVSVNTSYVDKFCQRHTEALHASHKLQELILLKERLTKKQHFHFKITSSTVG